MSVEQEPAPPTVNSALADLSVRITVIFSLFTAVTFLIEPVLDLVYAIVSAMLFFVGTFILGLGFWNGIQRSRVEDVPLAGLLAVDKSFVPVGVRNKLWLAVVVQILVTWTFAGLRPITQQAFGVLVPTLGVGMAALWGSRFAKFHPRTR